MSSGAQMLAGGVMLLAIVAATRRMVAEFICAPFHGSAWIALALSRFCRLHRRIHRLRLAAAPRIADESGNLCVRQSRGGSDDGLLSGRRAAGRRARLLGGLFVLASVVTITSMRKPRLRPWRKTQNDRALLAAAARTKGRIHAGILRVVLPFGQMVNPFPGGGGQVMHAISRRDFLKTSVVAGAIAGMRQCCRCSPSARRPPTGSRWENRASKSRASLSAPEPTAATCSAQLGQKGFTRTRRATPMIAASASLRPPKRM